MTSTTTATSPTYTRGDLAQARPGRGCDQRISVEQLPLITIQHFCLLSLLHKDGMCLAAMAHLTRALTDVKSCHILVEQPYLVGTFSSLRQLSFIPQDTCRCLHDWASALSIYQVNADQISQQFTFQSMWLAAGYGPLRCFSSSIQLGCPVQVSDRLGLHPTCCEAHQTTCTCCGNLQRAGSSGSHKLLAYPWLPRAVQIEAAELHESQGWT